MKIHIVCGPFYPQLHPRAFRYTELAKEFIRNGHEVRVTNYVTVDGFNYDEYAKEIGIKEFVRLGIYHKATKGDGPVSTRTKYPKLVKIRHLFTEYFLGGSTPYRSLVLSKKLMIEPDTDMIIAGSTPFITIFGTSYYLKHHKFPPSTTLIADSGDPYYYSSQNKRGPWFRIMEERAYKQFDYLSIPVETAIPCYDRLLPKHKIRVIPQGLNMKVLKLYDGEFSKPVKFAYCGVFYMNIRNPEFLFSFLDAQDLDFEFHLFMRYQEPAFTDMLNKYPKLKSKTIIVNSLERDKLIYELSRMDFLVNISNLSNTQIPSKLIDYGIANRPIYDCNEENFDRIKLLDFLNGNYHDSLQVDISKYDIVRVAQQFIDLYNEKNNNLK